MADEKKALPDEALEQVSGGTLNKREVTQYGMEDTLYDPSLVILRSASVKENIAGDLTAGASDSAPGFPIERCASVSSDTDGTAITE